MTKESLEQWTVAELMSYCREHGIRCYNGKNRMHKSELVTAILQAEQVESGHTTKSAGDKNEIGNPAGEAVVNGKEAATGYKPVINMERKMPYIESAQVGTLVAFRLANGRVKSAKIVKKSTKNRRFMLETEYGAQYIVSYDDIVWVRTTKRWPLGVYKLLKGMVDDGQQAHQ